MAIFAETRKLLPGEILPDTVEQNFQAIQQSFKKPDVNLDLLEVDKLTKQLIDNFQQNNDTGIIRSFFRTKKYEKQKEMIGAMEQLVASIRSISKSAEDFKTHLFAKQYILPLIIQGQIEEAQRAIVVAREEYKTFLVKQEIDRQRAHAELDRIKLENDSIRLDHELKRAENRLVTLRGDLIDKVTNDLDLKNISPPQAFVLIKALNPNSKESDVFMAQEQLEQMKAEAEIKKATARKAGYEADYEEYKMKESMKPSDV